MKKQNPGPIPICKSVPNGIVEHVIRLDSSPLPLFFNFVSPFCALGICASLPMLFLPLVFHYRDRLAHNKYELNIF